MNTPSEAEELDAAAVSLIRTWQMLGHTCVVLRSDTEEHFRLICPGTLQVAPILRSALDELEEREKLHRC